MKVVHRWKGWRGGEGSQVAVRRLGEELIKPCDDAGGRLPLYRCYS